jgi:exosortase O
MHNQQLLARMTLTPALLLWWSAQWLLVAMALYLFAPALSWMWAALLQQEHRYQLMGVLLLIGFVLHNQVVRVNHFTRLPRLQFRPAPLILFICSAMGFVFNEYFIDIHILSASLAVFAAYAFLGFYCTAEIWRKGLLPTLLLILLLPFGDYLDVYLGFPLRLFTAYESADVLSALGYPSMSSETIIVLENNVANVDLSCSGIKGVWSGLAFFVLLTWIEAKPIRFAWVWRLGVFVLALIAANIIRVTCLVLLSSYFTLFPYADRVHEVLGIIGFALACLIGWGLLLTLRRQPISPANPLPSEIMNSDLTLLSLVAFMVALNLLYTPMSKAATQIINTELTLPEPWAAQAMALTFQEERFFNQNEARANKYTTRLNSGLNASLIAVHSAYWKGQHDPKNCLISQGYKIVDDTTLRLSETERIRYLNVMQGNTHLVAMYWFQNEHLLTDDYSQRLFSSLLRKNEHWVLASMLIQTSPDHTVDIRDVIGPIKYAIQQKLAPIN